MTTRHVNKRVVPGKNAASSYRRWVDPGRPTCVARPLTEEQKAFAAGYLHLCRAHARRFVKRVPRNVDAWDLHQAAYEGLSDAVRTFDPSRGVEFESHARGRMVGAIQEMLRKEGVVRNKRRGARREELRCVSIDAIADVARLGGSGFVMRAEALLPVDDSGPSESLEAREGFELWLRHMDPEDRFIIESYYGHEELSMREIGVRLGVSQGRIWQRHAVILDRLRKKAESPRFLALRPPPPRRAAS